MFSISDITQALFIIYNYIILMFFHYLTNRAHVPAPVLSPVIAIVYSASPALIDIKDREDWLFIYL